MGTEKRYIPLRGSVRPQLDGESGISPADPDEIIDVTLVLRGRRELTPGDYNAPKRRPWQRHHLSREEWGYVYGTSGADISRVNAFARDNDLNAASSGILL